MLCNTFENHLPNELPLLALLFMWSVKNNLDFATVWPAIPIFKRKSSLPTHYNHGNQNSGMGQLLQILFFIFFFFFLVTWLKTIAWIDHTMFQKSRSNVRNGGENFICWNVGSNFGSHYDGRFVWELGCLCIMLC